MTVYTAKKGERLDTIVYRHYGTVEMRVLGAVMEANAELLGKIVYDGGEKVVLPEIEIQEEATKGKALW